MIKKILSTFLIFAIFFSSSLTPHGATITRNGTMMQYFDWYTPADGQHWNRLRDDAKHLNQLGITAVWLPPAYKGFFGSIDQGYATYDLYDLGEFNQKGSVRTKYGTKSQYLNAIDTLHQNGVQVYGDIVINHKMGADYNEDAYVTEVNPSNRNESFTTFMKTIPTGYNFPGRQGKYSTFTWNKEHFDGVDEYGRIFRLAHKSWDNFVDWENGNYDYLMGADLDMESSEVINELDTWGNWYTSTAKLDGYRLDAVKHVSSKFMKNWVQKRRENSGRNLFSVGEYWSTDMYKLENYLRETDYSLHLFDVPLHQQFIDISYGNGQFDMGYLGQNTLTQKHRFNSVTFVDNHDSQPGQVLGPSVNNWFKLQAYAYILTREEGYPCIFYGDYYGVTDPGHQLPSLKKELDTLMYVRRDLAYGQQHDYFDHKDIVGWTREGDSSHPKSALAVLLNDGPSGYKYMYVGRQHAGKSFYDITRNTTHTVTIDHNGGATFKVEGGSYSVYIAR